MSSLELAKIGLNGIATAIQAARNNQAHSLIDYAKATRVEPLVMVDADVLFEAATSDIMQSLLAQFSAYYLQAVAISTNVGNINVLKQLDRLNPNRSVGADVAFQDNMQFTFESYAHRLPNYHHGHRVALEAADIPMPNQHTVGDADETKVGGIKFNIGQKESGSPAMLAGAGTKDNSAMIRESSNLSVGKILGVEIIDGQSKMVVPVAVRLMVNTVPSSTLTHILSVGSKDKSALGRYKQWRLGELDFWKDLVACQDLIDEHRQALLHDKDGLYTATRNRKRNNGLLGMLNGAPSLGTISNMAVISKETATAVELEMNGSLNSPKTRERIFDDTALMILAVYDKDFDRVTFYYHGIAQKTELGVRDIKSANKGDGPSITDLMKAYSMGAGGAL